MTSYEYTVSDFKGKVNNTELENQINKVDTLSSKFNHITISGDKVNILFTEDINKTTLDDIVKEHAGSSIPDLDTKAHMSINKKVSNTIYTNSGKMMFNGGSFAKFFVVSMMDKELTSYSIRIFDKLHSKTIVENTFTNTEEGINEIGCGYVSSCKSILEVHIKVNKSESTNTEEELYVCCVQDLFIEFN